MKQTIKKVILGPVDWFLYSVLSEQQRKELTDKFSDEQKQKIKKVLFGKKQAQRKKLKQIKYQLYNLGFTVRAYQDLERYFKTITDPQLKRLAAWELTLWHANQNTAAGSKQALNYIDAARAGEKDVHQLRRVAILEAECYEATGQVEKAKQVIEEMLAEQEHADLYLAAANLEDDIDNRLEWMNKAMTFYGLQPIYFSNRNKHPEYDDLETEAIDRQIMDGPKVSVILPAFKAEEGIRIAIESILSQTWQNIELLAVDDCSPDNTAAVIQEYADKDERIKLLSTPENSGPYVARNIALQHATGEFVTINDADDWSHREKIEQQVTHLIDNEDVIANTSEHARLTEDLKLYRRGTPGKYIFPNMSSIMFRRKQVAEKIGHWDSVRFAADGEFKRRLIKAFGKSSYVDLQTGPLSLPRQSVTSLTASSAFGYNGFFMGVRREYVEAMEAFHSQTDSLYYDYPMIERPFQVPEPMWPKRLEKGNGKRQVDLVIASDFRFADKNILHMLNQAIEAKKTVGIVQLHKYMSESTKLTEEIRNLINASKINLLVYGEKIDTKKLFVFDTEVLKDKQRYVPEVHAAETFVILTKAETKEDFQVYEENLAAYFQTKATWHAVNSEIEKACITQDEAPRLNQVFHERWVYDE
ncbi:glycosyltransferase [Oceanobacillus sp. FSL H7-0719]|uniref:glycosyltransferase n=1 Tax=Oceanobacillus sp. FSL H7-0719 TaxID=2954507 RepID=UPI00324EA5CF